MGQESHNMIDTFIVVQSCIFTEALQFIVENTNCIRKCFIALMFYLSRFGRRSRIEQ